MPKDLEVRIERKEKGLPLCPHCQTDLAQVDDYRNSMPKAHFLHNLHVIACPQCRKVLGTAILTK